MSVGRKPSYVSKKKKSKGRIVGSSGSGARVVLSCSNCGTSRPNMSSIPMGAHAAFKVRDSLNSSSGDRNEKQQPSMSFSNTADAGAAQVTQPTRYSSKLMNSVWGMYNRYSVHNIKSHIAYDKN